MRRLSVLPLLAFLLVASPVGAAEKGTIEGRVLNETTGEPQPGVTVTLTGGGAGGEGFTDTTVTDRRGRYSFEDLQTGEDLFYAVDASFQGGLFTGRPISLPDDTTREPVIDTTLRVWAPTTDPNAILIRRNDLFVVHRAEALTVIESVRVVNPTNNAYVGRGAEMGDAAEEGPTPSLGFALPDGALPDTLDWLDADIDVPETVAIPGLGFGITSAIPPGQMSFTFTYQVEGSGGTFDLSRTAPYAISELSVFAETPLETSGNRLTDDGRQEIEGIDYARSSSTASIDPADPIQILIVAEGGSSNALLMGLGVGLAAIVVAAAFMFTRTKRTRTKVEPESRPLPSTRDELLTAIVELDAVHDAGRIDDAAWARRRAELKARLTSMPAERVP